MDAGGRDWPFVTSRQTLVTAFVVLVRFA